MKKILKIIFINFLAILTILVFADWFLLANEFYKPYWLSPATSNWAFFRPENDISFDDTKKSVITAGCSFTFGSYIELEDTFAYKLQQYTNRKVYNVGISGFGPQQLLWQIQHDDFFNKKQIIEPEYYIYTFISDHIRRMYANYFDLGAQYDNWITGYYKVRNKKLIPRKKDIVTFEDYIKISKVMKLLNYTMYRYIKTNDQKFDLLKLYLHEINNELKKRYPNIKPVIIIYNLNCDTYTHNNSIPFLTDRWHELEDEGFILIHFDTPDFDYLNTNEFLTWDNIHPSGKSWDSLVPIIADKLKL